MKVEGWVAEELEELVEAVENGEVEVEEEEEEKEVLLSEELCIRRRRG